VQTPAIEGLGTALFPRFLPRSFDKKRIWKSILSGRDNESILTFWCGKGREQSGLELL